MPIFAKDAVAKVSLLGLGLALFLPVQPTAAVESQPQTITNGVVVTNGLGRPVPAHDVDNPAEQPFQYTLSPYSGSSSTATDYYVVPAGKRLVIEYYSAQLTQYPLPGYAYLYLTTTAGGSTASYKIIPPSTSTVPVNQITRLYADPLTIVQAQVSQSTGTSSGGVVILSGYFVNVH